MSKKFDVVIGNPPYQETNKDNNRDAAIYPYFYDAAKDIATKYSLITPARFLFNIGATPKKWNEKMLSDKHLKVLYYNAKSAEVFSNTDIKGGVAILYRDKSQAYEEIGTFIGFDELKQVLVKVDNLNFSPLSSILYNSTGYSFTPKVHVDYPLLKSRVSKSKRLVIGSNAFDRYPEVFTDNKQSESDVLLYGRQNNVRIFKGIDSRYISHSGNLMGFKVFLTGANGSGEFGEVLSNPTIGFPNVGHTQTFISMGNFDTRSEAEALLKYIKGKFSRAMLGIKKVTQNNISDETWSKIPLQDFTENSDIDWSKSIAEVDQQLYKKYNLTEEEIDFIETNVKEMD